LIARHSVLRHCTTETETEIAEKEAGADPAKILREVTDNLGRNMPAEYLDVARHSDLGNLSWAPLLYRHPWAILTGPAARGAVTVAGDAFHPMTPDMAQGGCSAPEDAVVLARALSRAATPAAGVAAYVSERRWRAAWMVAGAYLSGWVQQGGTNVQGVRGYMVRLFRDCIFYRFLFPRLADTMWFNCGELVERKEQGKTHSE
jgi:2-polyprenyl-6-methoxyphenol hydroxylase-like FAD-dependent oxidoreductase